MLWHLWSRNRLGEPQGVFSHATALTLHDLSDVMPAKLDMTVPPGFRRMAATPDVLRLHHARLSERDVQTIDGVRATTPLRTLIDVIAEGVIAPELQVQAVDQALRRGLIMGRHPTIAYGLGRIEHAGKEPIEGTWRRRRCRSTPSRRARSLSRASSAVRNALAVAYWR
jgi:hypothetical protein